MSPSCRPTPLAPAFGCSPDALYTPRPTGRGRDPRLSRGLGRAAPASAPEIDQGLPEPAQDTLPAARQGQSGGATAQVSTEAGVRHKPVQREGFASEATQSDAARPATDGAAAQGKAEAQGVQQNHDQLLCKESFLSSTEAKPAAISPPQPQSDVLLADEELEASGASELQAQSPRPVTSAEQAHAPVLTTGNPTYLAQANPRSTKSGTLNNACQDSQQEPRPMREHESAAAAAFTGRPVKSSDPGLQADSLSSAPLQRPCNRQQWMTLQDSKPSASTGNPPAAHLPAQAADEDVKPKVGGAIAPAAQTRYSSPPMSI